MIQNRGEECSEEGSSREFKLEAVKLVRERGGLMQAAGDLDLHEMVLRKWARTQDADPVLLFLELPEEA